MFHWLLLIILALCIFLPAFSAYPPRYEYDLLWQIWNQTNGPYWQYLHPNFQVRGAKNWSFHDYYHYNPCYYPWVGVLCDSRTSRIMFIDLSGGAVKNISGTLPPIINNLTSLLSFSITENDLRGPMPTFIDTPLLLTLNLSYNHLTGSIQELDPKNLSSLNYIGLSNNHLNSTIPSCLFEIPSLQYVSFSHNELTGTLPQTVSDAKTLLSFNVNNNQLRGHLPHILPPKLEQLFMDYNQFSGPLPDVFSPHLETIRLSVNQLTGSIPDSICKPSNLSFIALYSNLLTGSLPGCLGSLRNLTVFQAQNNQLHGQLSNKFNAELQVQLAAIDVSDNAITGTFPGELFHLPNIVSIAAGKNCFHGELPTSICNSSRTLSIISLDGMQSSSLCLQYLWDPMHLTVGYYAKLMEGSVPSCIWSLPSLSVLHLSGNGFGGYLPSDIALPNTLKFVAITHNEFRGEIPANFQNHPFMNLDLSYNKFKGMVTGFQAMPFYNGSSNSLSASSSLKLQENSGEQITVPETFANLVLKVNRLSGPVPSTVHYAYNVDILSGNLFQCKSMASLPQHDPSHQTYFCGSQEMDSAAFVSGVIMTFVGIIMLFTFFHHHVVRCIPANNSGKKRYVMNINKEKLFPFFRRFRLCLIYAAKYCSAVQKLILRSYKLTTTSRSSDEEYDEEQRILSLAEREMHQYSNIMQYLATLNLIRRLSCFVACYSLFLCLPVYLSFYALSPMVDHTAGSSSMYSTHEQRYTWGTTSAFITGRLPAAILLTLWTLLLWLFLFMIIRHYRMFAWLKRTKLSEIVGRASLINIRRLSFFAAPSSYTPAAGEDDDKTALFQPQDEEEEERKMELEIQQTVNLLDHEISTGQQSSNFQEKDKLNNSQHDSSFRTSEIETLHIDDIHKEVRQLSLKERFLKYAIIIPLIYILNLSVSIAINAAYLLLQDAESISPGGKITIQVLMAGFKIFWNMVPIRLLMNRLQYGKSTSKLHVTLLLTNTVLAPCLATAFTDRSCFADFFFGADSICSAYDLNICTDNYIAYDNGLYFSACTAYSQVTFETSFTPTFIYYYSCGSKLLTAYIPVFIYSYTMLLFIAPLVYLALTSLQTDIMPNWLLRMIDGAVRPQDRGIIAFTNLVRGGATQAMLAQHLVVLLTFGVNSPILAVVMALAITVDTAMWQVILVRYIKFDTMGTPFCPQVVEKNVMENNHESEEAKEVLMANVVQSSSSPLDDRNVLDESLLLRESTSLLLNEQVTLMRESEVMSNSHNRDKLLSATERERLYELHTVVGRSWLTLRNTMWLCFYWAMMFYGFILFDIAGDHAGWEQALWVVICCLALILFTRFFMLDLIIFAYAAVTGQQHFRNSLRDNSSSRSKYGSSFVKGMRSSDFGAKFL